VTFLVDFMMPIGFEASANQFLPVMMVMHLGRCNRCRGKREEAENHNHGSKKTFQAIHLHSLTSSLTVIVP
jgi:hypothetical protein